MSEYTKRLHKFINGYEFVRCFYGECPDCGKHVFSVGDDAIGSKIKAKFICDCGKKWIETVYYLQILLIAGIFMVMETLIRCFIKSSGQVDRLFHITIIKH